MMWLCFYSCTDISLLLVPVKAVPVQYRTWYLVLKQNKQKKHWVICLFGTYIIDNLRNTVGSYRNEFILHIHFLFNILQ